MAIVNQHPAFANLGKQPQLREIPVTDSKFLSMFRYDQSSNQLTVVFKNGSEYIQQFIYPMTVDQLIESPNKSKFYVDNIRGKSPHTKLIDKTVGPALRRDHGNANRNKGAGTNTGAKGRTESTGGYSGSGAIV